MICLQSGFEHDTVAVRLSGVIQQSDYRNVLVPALERKLQDHASVKLWIEIDSDCRGMRLSTLWQEMLIGLFHLDDFCRVAIVAEKAAFRRLTVLIALLLPCPVRVFSLTDREKARIWLSDKG